MGAGRLVSSARKHHPGAGFTLLELLVVMVILAMFAGMAVLSIGDNLQRNLVAEAERLQAVMIAASDEAVYTGTEYGIHLAENSYQVLRWERLARQWMTIPSQAFAKHSLPEGIAISWSVDGFVAPDETELVDIEFGKQAGDSLFYGEDDDGYTAASDDDEEENAGSDPAGKVVDDVPQVLLLSSAELSVFDIEFAAAEPDGPRTRVSLRSDGFSLPTVKLLDADEDSGL